VDVFQYLGPTGPDRFLAASSAAKGVYGRTLIHDLGRLLAAARTWRFCSGYAGGL
jgi:hypothetical protein